MSIFISGKILANTTNIDKVLVRRIKRHWVLKLCWVVYNLDTWSILKNSASLIWTQRLLKLNSDGLRVRTHCWNANASAINAQFRKVHNLATLVLHLHFLRGIANLIKAADLWNQINCQLVCKWSGLGYFPTCNNISHLVLQARKTRQACT